MRYKLCEKSLFLDTNIIFALYKKKLKQGRNINKFGPKWKIFLTRIFGTFQHQIKIAKELFVCKISTAICNDKNSCDQRNFPIRYKTIAPITIKFSYSSLKLLFSETFSAAIALRCSNCCFTALINSLRTI